MHAYIWGAVHKVSADICQYIALRVGETARYQGGHDSRRVCTQNSGPDTLLLACTTCFMYESLEHLAGRIQCATACPKISKTPETYHKVRELAVRLITSNYRHSRTRFVLQKNEKTMTSLSLETFCCKAAEPFATLSSPTSKACRLFSTSSVLQAPTNDGPVSSCTKSHSAFVKKMKT